MQIPPPPGNQPSAPKREQEVFLSKFEDAKHVPLETKAGKFDGYYLSIDKLTEEEKHELFEMLAPIALNAFGRDGDEQFKNDCWKYLCENNHIFVVFESGKSIAYRQWATLKTESQIDSAPKEIVYLGGAFISRDSQGKGLATKMIDFVHTSANETNPNWKYLAVVTQNSIIQRTFNSFVERMGYGTLYQFGDTDIPLDVQEVARAVAKSDSDDKLDPTTLLSKGSYGDTVYRGETQVSDLNKGTSFEKLDVNEGDAAYSVWKR